MGCEESKLEPLAESTSKTHPSYTAPHTKQPSKDGQREGKVYFENPASKSEPTSKKAKKKSKGTLTKATSSTFLDADIERMCNIFGGLSTQKLQVQMTGQMQILADCQGKWPLAERTWIKRTIQKFLVEADIFMKSDDVDAEMIEGAMDALLLPMTQTYDGVWGMADGAAENVKEIEAMLAMAKKPTECSQSITDFCTLYQCAFQADSINREVLKEIEHQLPDGNQLLIGDQKDPNRGIEKIITKSLSADASCLKDVLRCMVRIKMMRHFPRVVDLFLKNKKIEITAIRNGLTKSGWRDIKIWYTLVDDPSSVVIEAQLVLEELFIARDRLGGHNRYAGLRKTQACLALKLGETSGKHPKIVELETKIEAFVASKNYRRAAEVQEELELLEGIATRCQETEAEVAIAAAKKDYKRAAELQDLYESLERQLHGIDDSTGFASPKKTASPSAAAAHLARHEGYPDLPLLSMANWDYGTMVNLSYPGLQMVYKSPITGTPIFIVPNFLSQNECDRLLAKCSGLMINSKATSDVVKRTSKHVRVVKSETPGLHARLAAVTNHDARNMESAKIIRYQDGAEFECHSDFQAGVRSTENMVSLTGSMDQFRPHVNREITCFMYLNDVEEGGETAFWEEKGSRVKLLTRAGDFSTAHTKIKPERGLLVMFYPTLQPSSGVLPEITDTTTQYMNPVKEQAFYPEGMWHAGLPAKGNNEKYIMAIWSWPKWVNKDKSLLEMAPHFESRETDGIVV